MAGGAEWMSAAIILSAASALFPTAHDGRAVVIGLTGGYILLAVLIAPFLRNSGAHTVPDFLAARYGGNLVRLLAVIVLIACSLIFAIALIEGAVVIASRVARTEPECRILSRARGDPSLRAPGRHARGHGDAGRPICRAVSRLRRLVRDFRIAKVRCFLGGSRLRPGDPGAQGNGARTRSRAAPPRGRFRSAYRKRSTVSRSFFA